jgi:mRNA interferase MazF
MSETETTEEYSRDVPDQGNIILCDLSPTKGHEQSGYRPSLVMSRKSFNQVTGFLIICPITSTIRNFPFEEPFNTGKTSGVLLTHHIKTIDWRYRKTSIVDHIDEATLQKVQSRIKQILS